MAAIIPAGPAPTIATSYLFIRCILPFLGFIEKKAKIIYNAFAPFQSLRLPDVKMDRKIKMHLVVAQAFLILPELLFVLMVLFSASFLGPRVFVVAGGVAFLVVIDTPMMLTNRRKGLDKEWSDYIRLNASTAPRLWEVVGRILPPGRKFPNLYLHPSGLGHAGLCTYYSKSRHYIGFSESAVRDYSESAFEVLVAHEVSHMLLRHNEFRILGERSLFATKAYLVALPVLAWVLAVTQCLSQPLMTFIGIFLLSYSFVMLKKICESRWDQTVESAAWLQAALLTEPCKITRYLRPVGSESKSQATTKRVYSFKDSHAWLYHHLRWLEGERGRESA
jgi:hypothetical protein